MANSVGALDDIEAAHAAVRGPAKGRKAATLRLTHAYVLLLSSQFQRFARDLHSEAMEWLLIEQKLAPAVHVALLGIATQGRALDRGNPTPENIRRDFRWIRRDFWQEVERDARLNAARRKQLDALNSWRNAIAHHDFTKPAVPSEQLPLAQVRAWRRACNGRDELRSRGGIVACADGRPAPVVIRSDLSCRSTRPGSPLASASRAAPSSRSSSGARRSPGR